MLKNQLNFCTIHCPKQQRSLICIGSAYSNLQCHFLHALFEVNFRDVGMRDIYKGTSIRIMIILLFSFWQIPGSTPISSYLHTYLFRKFLEIAVELVMKNRSQLFLSLQFLQSFLPG